MREIDGKKVAFVDSESYFASFTTPSMVSTARRTGADVVLASSAAEEEPEICQFCGEPLPVGCSSKFADDPDCADEQPKPERLESGEWQPTPCPTCGGFCGDAGPTCAEVAEQAQAGELPDEIKWALNGLPQLAINLRFEQQTSRADTVERIIALLRRLAGGATVDDAMTERALDAFDDACIVHNKTAPDPATYEYRVSWFGYSREHRLAVMRAALVAALGAK